MVAGRRDDVQHPAAEVELGDVVRPVRDLEEGRDLRRGPADHDRVRPLLELHVAHPVVAVTVAVGDDQRNRVSMVGFQPVGDHAVYRRAHLQAAGPGVEQQGAVLAEQQVEEGGLEVGLHRLADDVGVGVVALHLRLRLGGHGPVDPGLEQRLGGGQAGQRQDQGGDEGRELHALLRWASAIGSSGRMRVSRVGLHPSR